MTRTDKVQATRERPFSAHHMLLGAATMSLEDAEQKKPGHFYSTLISLTMASLAVEALCNAIGERVIEDWQDFESSSPKAKVRTLCRELGLEYQSQGEPWATVIWLGKFRNKIAHAKPERVSESYTWTRDEYEKKDGLKPESKLEKEVTLGHAKRAVEQVTQLKYLLCKNVPAEKAFGLAADMWSGSTGV